MKDLTFIVPAFNASKNINKLILSLQTQKDVKWTCVVIDDLSDDRDDLVKNINAFNDERISIVLNDERKFALRNIVEQSLKFDSIIAVIDGDDSLCNDDTVTLIKNAYVHEHTVAWTKHKWDINGLNISENLDKNINPYQTRWVSSHLRTFDSALLKMINVNNFKDAKGQWFKRGYDQALMLPLLFKTKNRVFIPEVCYLYNINSCSIQKRDWNEKEQLNTVNFVRSRGFIE